MSRKKTGCVEQMRKVRHMHGYHATREELDVVVAIAQKSKIDAWFGEIEEAKAMDGSVVHVVHDLERDSWLTFKYAVRLLDEGITAPEDYVSKAKANVFRRLIKKLRRSNG